MNMPKFTMQQMCKEISDDLKKKNVFMTPEEIYNYSPTGELFHIFQYFLVLHNAKFDDKCNLIEWDGQYVHNINGNK